jgi:hypothetical protein
MAHGHLSDGVPLVEQTFVSWLKHIVFHALLVFLEALLTRLVYRVHDQFRLVHALRREVRKRKPEGPNPIHDSHPRIAELLVRERIREVRRSIGTEMWSDVSGDYPFWACC